MNLRFSGACSDRSGSLARGCPDAGSPLASEFAPLVAEVRGGWLNPEPALRLVCEGCRSGGCPGVVHVSEWSVTLMPIPP